MKPDDQDAETRHAGRPRDEATAPILKEVALRLVRERGYGKVSISAIIEEAGVSRQSLYRRWPTKADLVLEALFDAAPLVMKPENLREPGSKVEPVSGPSVRAVLTRLLTEIFTHLARDGQILRNLVAAAQEDPHFRESFVSRFVRLREAIVTDLLHRAKANGELRPEADVDVLTDFFHGAFWYRLLIDKPLDAEFAKRIVEEMFA